MNKVFSLLIIILIITGCGKAKSPTGGPVDKEPLKIEAIFPDQYESISDKEVEIYFNKEVDRKTAQNAFRFYPVIEDFEIETDDNKVSLVINEELISDRNYYLTISTLIKDTRNNTLDKNVTYTYSNGELHDNKIYGDIIYSLDEDKSFEKRLIFLDQDSVTVFIKNFMGHRYDIDGLEKQSYIIRSFIDKDNNGRYDIEKEPYFESFIDSLQTVKLDIELAYVDTSRVIPKRITALNNSLIKIEFSEELSQYDSLSMINLSDSTKFQYDSTLLLNDELFIITEPQDTLKYQVTLTNLIDNHNNINPKYSLTFHGKTSRDTLSLNVIDISPKNGTAVSQLQPKISLQFDKIVKGNDLKVSLTENETGKEKELVIIQADAFEVILQPLNNLQNFNSYTLNLSDQTVDYQGNKLTNDFESNFLVTSSE